ncbi:hypothetical protein FGO68_gene16295 [Halteria grandinella]|uniref:Uncharacterized protein n=1 Tax=Halteria grandinella TaxID=5974 RepID=A0A8J8P711_HALGN|nr:hypothetical protein FGO68_gene16295 [Halteria grandinella]
MISSYHNIKMKQKNKIVYLLKQKVQLPLFNSQTFSFLGTSLIISLNITNHWSNQNFINAIFLSMVHLATIKSQNSQIYQTVAFIRMLRALIQLRKQSCVMMQQLKSSQNLTKAHQQTHRLKLYKHSKLKYILGTAQGQKILTHGKQYFQFSSAL